MLSALRRWVIRGRLDAARATVALDDLGQLRIEYHAHHPFRERAWNLRDRLSAYDATYVALAESLDATLVTADGALARATTDVVQVRDFS